METIDVILEVPKEGKEIVDALDALLENILSKAPISSYANLFDEIYAAGDGVQKVTNEIQSQYRDELAGYMVQKLMARLLPVEKPE